MDVKRNGQVILEAAIRDLPPCAPWRHWLLVSLGVCWTTALLTFPFSLVAVALTSLYHGSHHPNALYPEIRVGSQKAYVLSRGFPAAVWATSEGASGFVPPEPRTRILWGGIEGNIGFYAVLFALPIFIMVVVARVEHGPGVRYVLRN